VRVAQLDDPATPLLAKRAAARVLERRDRVQEGDPVPAGELLERSTAAGVTFVRGSDFFAEPADGRSDARFAFSYESPERIAEGVRIIAGLV
jgi:DNA-binding transcriptional MocR family regulator